MAHSVIKPVHFMCTAEALQYHDVALRGIREVLRFAGRERQIVVRDFGVWQTPRALRGGRLQPFQSIGWYVLRSVRASARVGQCNATQILRDMREEPWQRDEPHYDVFLSTDDMYDGSDGNNFSIGLTAPGFGSVISAARFTDVVNAAIRTEYVQTAVMHEVGHLFGLVSLRRQRNVVESLGLHCTNRCIMRQGLSVPDWYQMTLDRLSGRPFCEQCRRELQLFFINGAFTVGWS